MKLVIIANPISGGGRAYRLIRSHVQQWADPAWQIEIQTTRGPDDAGFLAQELLRNPPDLLGICGGDGTVNEFASRVPRPPFPVAVLPAGTANVIAREVGIPLNPIQALQIALRKNVRSIDLGELGTGNRRFLFVAGIGFDAFVVKTVNPGLKKKIGMAAYAAAILNSLQNYSFPEFDVSVGGRTYTATSCLACNARSYGGGLLFCPEADMSDGLLDILVLEGRRRLNLARFLLNAWFGKAESGAWIHRLKASEFQIEGRLDVPVQADGELVGRLPLHITLHPSSFPLIVP